MSLDSRIHIIGAGLAGINLCWQFWNRGYSNITLHDSQLHQSSSNVAAGMFNPVVFRRINPSWMIHTFLPEMKVHYQKIEKIIGQKFLHHIDTLRIFHDAQYANDWLLKQDNPELVSFLVQAKTRNSHVNQSFGVGKVLGSGYLDVKSFIKSSLQFFESERIYKKEDLNLDELTKLTSQALVIFCRGMQDSQDGPFSYLPFAPVKGEVLTIKTKNVSQEHIISKKHWLLPIGKNSFKLGATYDWRNINWEASEKGEEELITKLHEMVSIQKESYSIEQHMAGVRPATKDRRPFLGAHPNLKKVYLFNGMGSKAVLMSPWLAKHFVEFIIEDKPLLREVNIKRYQSHYHE